MNLGRILAAPIRTVQAAAEQLATSLGQGAGARLLADGHEALAERRSAQESSLIRALGHRRQATRARAALELGMRRSVASRRALVAASRDPKKLVRQAALTALLLIDPESFVDAAMSGVTRTTIEQRMADLDAVRDAVAALGRESSVVELADSPGVVKGS